MAYKVLVTDKLQKQGIEILQKYPEIEVIEKDPMSGDVLKDEIKNYDAVIIRSATKLTRDILESAGNLKVVSRAGVGVDNIDVAAATEKGIVVMNAPSGNTISTAEHTFAMMIALARKIPFAYQSIMTDKWDRKSYKGVELLNKTLGVIGMGRIGSEVVKRAKAFGMTILAYDPFMSDEKAAQLGVEVSDLDKIYKESDFITLHTPLTEQTRGMIGKEQFAKMKKSVMIVNCARGGIADEQALADALNEGVIAGAAVDVYSQEPPFDPRNPLLDAKNIILVPHLGASTEEAQFNVAIESAECIANFLVNNVVMNSLNMPSLAKDTYEQLADYIKLAEKLGLLTAQLIEGQIEEVKLSFAGEITEYDVSILTRASLKGLFQAFLGDTVNYVNAVSVAKSRGIKVIEEKDDFVSDFSNLIKLSVKSDEETVELWGSVYSNKMIKVVKINEYFFELDPEGIILAISNIDKPGVIGSVGTVLGKHEVNIAGMRLGRDPKTGEAMTLLSVDSLPDETVRKELTAIEAVRTLKIIKL